MSERLIAQASAQEDGQPLSEHDAADRATSRRFGAVYAIPCDAVAEPSRHDPAWLRLAYRAMEIFIALVVLLLSLPVLLVQALLIRLDSPGPVLFRQTRVGRSRRVLGRDLKGRTDLVPPVGHFEDDRWYYVPTTFRFLKFRTMYIDSWSRYPAMYDKQFPSHEAFRASPLKTENDPRITRIGSILRRLTVDELPNMWNVLTGDVRLVGPRPETPCHLPNYKPDEMVKFTVHPGITGYQQTRGRGNLNKGESIDCDLLYVKERCVAVDLRLLALTFWLVIVRRGAF